MRTTAHPYMANSVPALKQEMLDAIGAAGIEELFAQIPESHRLRGELDLPPALASEVELSRHLREALARNETCERNLSFLGAGCWQHHVPAICDEIVRRSEFVTPVWGTPSSDYGRNQAWFEFCSQLGELLSLDFVGLPLRLQLDIADYLADRLLESTFNLLRRSGECRYNRHWRRNH